MKNDAIDTAKHNFEVARDAVSGAVLRSILAPIRNAGLPAPINALNLYYTLPNASQAPKLYRRLLDELNTLDRYPSVDSAVEAAIAAAERYNALRSAPATPKPARTLAADSGRYPYIASPDGPVDLNTAKPGTYVLLRYGNGTQLAVLTFNNSSAPLRRAQILRLYGRGQPNAYWSAPTYINKRDARILGRGIRANGDPIPNL